MIQWTNIFWLTGKYNLITRTTILVPSSLKNKESVFLSLYNSGTRFYVELLFLLPVGNIANMNEMFELAFSEFNQISGLAFITFISMHW